MGALVVSKEPEEGHPEAWEASEGLSGNQREVDGGARHRSQAEAWEEGVLSYLEAPGGPWEGRTGLGEACPWVGVGACPGEAAPFGLILVEQEVEAPCQEEREEAWASEAFLDACRQEGRVEVLVVVLRHPAGLGSPLMVAWP